MQLLLPAGLPGYEIADPSQQAIPGDIGVGACVVVTLPELQLQFRLHDYYMGKFFVNIRYLLLNVTSEMSLNVDTIVVCPEADCPEADFLSRSYESPKESLVIEGRIHAFSHVCRSAHFSKGWTLRPTGSLALSLVHQHTFVYGKFV